MSASRSVGSKIAIAFAVPTIIVGAFATWGFTAALSDMGTARTRVATVESIGAFADGVDALRAERLLAAMAELPDGDGEQRLDEDLTSARRSVDGALTAVSPLVPPIEFERINDALGAARSSPIARFDNYDRAIRLLLAVGAEATSGTDDPGIVLAAERAFEATEAAWIGFARRPSNTPRDVGDALQQFAAADYARTELALRTTPAERTVVEEALAGTAVMDELRLVATEDLYNDSEVVVTPAAALSTLGEASERWTSAIAELSSQTVETAELGVADAESRRNVFGVLGLLGVVGLAGLGFALRQEIVNPIRMLSADLERLVEQRLPALSASLDDGDAPDGLMPIEARDEIELNRLAAAVSETQDRFFRVARQQSVRRAKAARRTQHLAARNTAMLHQLVRTVSEWRGEDGDPGTHQRLFRIDHLATRMQRNLDGITAVTGGRTDRRWTNPVRAFDAVRLALGAIDTHDRIDIEAMEDARLRGTTAPAVAHILSEILDNALRATDPASASRLHGRVKVEGFWVPAGWAFAIHDQGRGLGAGELAELNRRLHSADGVDDGPTDFLGLIIAGEVARQLGVDVRLLEGADGGTVARVVLPVELMDPATVPPDRREISAGRGASEGRSSTVTRALESPEAAMDGLAMIAFFGESVGDQAPSGVADQAVATPGRRMGDAPVGDHSAIAGERATDHNGSEAEGRGRRRYARRRRPVARTTSPT